MHRGSALVRSAVVLITVAALAGCTDDEADDAPTMAGLDGKTFESTAVEGREMVAGTDVMISFEDDGIAVMAGCNTLFGGATITEGALEIGVMAQTMIACTDDLMAQDAFLTDFFTSGPAITLAGATLTLAGAEASIVADIVDE